MSFAKTVRHRIFPYWRSLVIVLTPLLLLPLPILGQYDGPPDGKPHKEALAAYGILIMAIYWMTEALPLPVTSLIPVFMFPVFGISDTGPMCMAYMKESNMMYLGGLVVALSIEYCNLHKRIALRVLMLVGSSPRRLMAGFMLVTAILSMWISNTATTAIMAPIVEAVVQELFKDEDEADQGGSEDKRDQTENTDSQEHVIASSEKVDREQLKKDMSQIRVGIMLSVAYASNIGGTGSIIGSGPQLAFKGIFNTEFPDQRAMNFATWMAFNVPAMIINVIFAWILLQFMFIGSKKVRDADEEVSKLIRQKYRDLGPMTFHEIAILFLFVTVVLAWFFRDPQFITGWSELIKDVKVEDSTAVVAVIILLFIIPAKPNFWCFRREGRGREKPSEALMTWDYIQRRLDWGIVLLLGGGFALSDASRDSGLSAWLGEQLSGLRVLPPFVIMLIICIMTVIVTEVASNTATANILLPILAQMSVTININPLYLMLPATVSCSYAFMLPVATAPNAIVFSAAKMKPTQMIKPGFVMNIICVIVLCVTMEFYGNVLFDLYTFPDWARPTNTTTTPPLQCNESLPDRTTELSFEYFK